MRKEGILNPGLISAVAALGHTEYLVIADAGLPIPPDVEVIDLSLKAGQPSLFDVLEQVGRELVVESFFLAEEITTQNTELYGRVCTALDGIPGRFVSHEEFKVMTQKARTVIRTGETSSFANIILVGGVNF